MNLRGSRVRSAAVVVAATLFIACASSPDTTESPRSNETQTTVVASLAPPPSASAEVDRALGGAPRVVIENRSTVDINLYTGFIVDEEGKLGTMTLWPLGVDCPKYEPKERMLKLRGVYDLTAPTHAFDEKRCASGAALPPGKYVVHIDSGYSSDLYAGGEITLPLTEAVRLKMEQHDAAPTCNTKRAQRAARLVLRASEEAGVPEAKLAGCDPTTAGCGSLPLPDEAPPSACKLTLHENLLRIRMPPTGEAPKEITGWLDKDLVFTQRPNVSRSSSAELQLGKDRVLFEGVTAMHIHEHGGDAAHVSGMQVVVTNPTKRALKVTVTGVEWLSDGSCGAPQPNNPPPKVSSFDPKVLPPGTTAVNIGFEPREAYQAHCDIFASRARLQVEGKEVLVTSEQKVTRIEPLHH
ncbi:MAG: hypothetical protein HOW73_23175 [Polyangiaceae bacterium]|nr:hypothetical protein [Polyangiaceae bacterium]